MWMFALEWSCASRSSVLSLPTSQNSSSVLRNGGIRCASVRSATVTLLSMIRIAFPCCWWRYRTFRRTPAAGKAAKWNNPSVEDSSRVHASANVCLDRHRTTTSRIFVVEGWQTEHPLANHIVDRRLASRWKTGSQMKKCLSLLVGVGSFFSEKSGG